MKNFAESLNLSNLQFQIIFYFEIIFISISDKIIQGKNTKRFNKIRYEKNKDGNKTARRQTDGTHQVTNLQQGKRDNNK